MFEAAFVAQHNKSQPIPTSAPIVTPILKPIPALISTPTQIQTLIPKPKPIPSPIPMLIPTPTSIPTSILVSIPTIGMQAGEAGGLPPLPLKNLQQPPCFKNLTSQAFSRNNTKVFPDINPKTFFSLLPNIFSFFPYNLSPKAAQKW